MIGADTVFHVAAHFKLWGPLATFRAMNVEGTRNVVTAAERAGVRRIVYVSAAAVVMGPPMDQHSVTEDAPLHRMGFAPYAATKAEAEEILRAANGRRKGLSTVAIRPPFIWGPDMPALDQMAESVKSGQFMWIAGGGQALSTCHVENLCEALILAADRGTEGAAYFVSDGADTTLKAFLTRLLSTRGVMPKDRSLPARRSLPNQATTRLTLSTAGAMACSRSRATTISASSGSALRFSAEVVPPVVWPKTVVDAPTVLRTASVA